LRGGVDDGEGDGAGDVGDGDGAGDVGDGDGAGDGAGDGDGDDGVPVVVVMARMCSRFAVLESEDSGRGLGCSEEVGIGSRTRML